MGFFAVNLKRLRKAAGLSQAELAKRVGLTQGTLTYLESGRSERGEPDTRWSQIVKFARVLEVSTSEFFRDPATAPEEKPDVGSLFANNLMRLRMAQGLSVATLADSAGIERQNISDIESGRNRDPGMSIVEALARSLGVETDEFLVESAPVDKPARWRPGQLKVDDMSIDDAVSRLSSLIETGTSGLVTSLEAAGKIKDGSQLVQAAMKCVEKDLRRQWVEKV